ncbi:MAG: hypothetical protein V4858_09885 [Pseudomonadota bacterium]
MFNTIKSMFSGAPRWLQYAALLVAGITSFFLAFKMGTRGGDATADAQAMIAKPLRAASSVPAVDLPLVAAPQVPASAVAPSRLEAGILQNPFAPLNLQASVDKPVVVAAAEPKPEKKPAPKPPPPPPPLPEPVPQPAPPPMAPPLPFVVIGAIRGQGIAQGKPVVFLNNGGVSLVVSQGDDIQGTYKVEAITANTIEFTYLPLGQRQSLSLAQ